MGFVAVSTSVRGVGNAREFWLFESYVSALHDVGCMPMLVPPPPKRWGQQIRESTDYQRFAAKVIDKCQGLMLTGGADIDGRRYGDRENQEWNGTFCEERDELEIELCRAAVKAHKPILGICRGLQVLVVAMGGSLYQDLHIEKGNDILLHRQWEAGDVATHSITIMDGSLLAKAIGRGPAIAVNSFHHQAARDVPAGFQIAAVAPDGVVEAVEAIGSDTPFGTPHPFTLGVQWHPERMARQDASAQAIFAAFAHAIRTNEK